MYVFYLISYGKKILNPLIFIPDKYDATDLDSINYYGERINWKILFLTKLENGTVQETDDGKTHTILYIALLYIGSKYIVSKNVEYEFS